MILSYVFVLIKFGLTLEYDGKKSAASTAQPRDATDGITDLIPTDIASFFNATTL